MCLMAPCLGPIVLLASVGGSAYAADTDAVSVSVSPSSLQLAPMERTSTVLTVRNGGSQPITEVALSWPTLPGVMITTAEPTVSQIPAGSSAAWIIDVTRQADVGVPNGLPITVAYQVQGAAGGAPFATTSTAVISLQDRPTKTAADLVDLHFQTSLTDLAGGREGTLYVTLKNTSAIPVTLTGLEVAVPSFLTACRDGTDCGRAISGAQGRDRLLEYDLRTTIGPQRIDTIRFVLRAGQAVEPGPHLMIVTAGLEWSEGGRSRTGDVTTSAQVSASVLGQSEILTLLGIPSLFVLPGFLIMVTFRLFWTQGSKRDFPWLHVRTPEFWLLAISLSLIAVLGLYPHVPFGSDITAGTYSLQDIATIWMGGIATGFAAYLMSQASFRSWAWWYIPGARDGPTLVLRKVHRNADPLRRLLRSADATAGALHRPLLQVTVDGQTRQALEIYWDGSTNDRWVAPPIAFDELRGEMPTEFRMKLLQALDESAAGTTARLLDEGHRRGYVRCRWQPSAGSPIGGPMRAEQVQPQGMDRRIVQRGRAP